MADTPAAENSRRPWHTIPVQQTVETLQTDIDSGLSDEQAHLRLQEYGPNELTERRGRTGWSILWDQVSSTMVLILVAACVISAFLGKTTETLAIGAIVLLFVILGFVQEYRAEKAMAALKKMATPIVRVRRNGQPAEIAARELVPGDIILLEAGSVVPADARLVESANLRVQEAALTGESEPVEKQVAALDREEMPLGDRVNLGFMGTSVSYGRGIAVVTATGMSTELGRIAELIQDVTSGMTPLQKRLDRVGKGLALFGVVVAGLVMIIGLMRGESLSDMFLTAVSVAVAVVPEGLPAVVTVTLALGAQRMLRRKALIRKLPAVETLGSVTVICSDKTGTLTENRMTVTVIDIAGHYLELVGTSRTAASAAPGDEKYPFLATQPPAITMVLTCGTLCNDASLVQEDGKPAAVGDPTEGALLVAAAQAGLNQAELQQALPRVSELPFDSDRKRMSTLHQLPADPTMLDELIRPLHDGRHSLLAVTKGAVDGLLDICSCIWDEGEPVLLDESWRQRLQEANDEMAQKGMRVLGVAIRRLDAREELKEEELTFLGLIGMIDPARPEVKEAVTICRKAGIRPIMITGDHPLTARFIAHDLGISTNGSVMTGQELGRLSSEGLEQAVQDVSVFARVSPEHKLRIVETLQQQGEIAAMTGDGVNDSPALRKANIGIAMGITGTDVSKEASDMVLLDDNFATIVAAVEEGRVIYDNIRRFIKFSIAGNLGKVLVMLLAPLIGITIALQPLQLLWLNLLTDGLLGLGLGVEPAGSNIMQRPPRSPKAPFFGRRLSLSVLWIGGLIGLLALAVGYVYYDSAAAGDGTWQTMIFTSIAFMQVGQALASRSSSLSFFSLGPMTNMPLFILVLLVILLQLVVLYVPFFHEFFKITALGATDLLICAALGVLIFAAIEIEKFAARKSQP